MAARRLIAAHTLAVVTALLPVAECLPLRHEVSTMVQLQRQVQLQQFWKSSAPGGGGLLEALQDQPPGSYFRLMEPVVSAVDITYKSTLKEFGSLYANATIPREVAPGEEWVRMPELEANPQEGGVHMRVFAEHARKQAICAFRGICVDNTYRQCQVDKCFLQSYQAFGKISGVMYEAGTNCASFAGEMNYFEQADSLVRRVQAQLAGYSVLLTGHSLGGAMSISVAASQPGVLRAITFAPSAFYDILLDHVGLSEVEIQNLPSEDLVALGDPYDCLINSAFKENARKGATTCLLEGLPEPAACIPRMQQDVMFDEVHLAEAALCKGGAHDWSRYANILLEHKVGGDAPAYLSTCSTGPATSEAAVLEISQRARVLPSA